MLICRGINWTVLGPGEVDLWGDEGFLDGTQTSIFLSYTALLVDLAPL